MSQKVEDNWKFILTDKYNVPKESKASFMKEVHKSATILGILLGFVEVSVYEKTDGESRHNVVTTAVWQDEEAFQNAKKSAGIQEDRLQSSRDHEEPERRNRKSSVSPVVILTGSTRRFALSVLEIEAA